MKIQQVSDLHLEFPGAEVDIENVDSSTDVLILGGDIITAVELAKWPDKYVGWFDRTCERFDSVLYVMGNHEHYHGHFQSTLETLKYYLGHIKNLTILEKDWVEMTLPGEEPILFLGATLWTDLNGNDDYTKHVLARGMNDYRLIDYDYEDSKGRTRQGHLLPTNTAEDHEKALLSFLEPLERGLKTVVLTHHSPSKRSTHPRYKYDREMNGGYSSDLERFIFEHPNIVLWTHGHTHDSFDYTIEKTRIVCNPAGYQHDVYRGKGQKYENENFDLRKVIEI